MLRREPACWLASRPSDPKSKRHWSEEDLRLIEANRRQDEETSDVIRRALRLLDREAWEERARADMHRLKSEDLSSEADAWAYDADGNIRIVGTNLTVQARPAERP
jgi:hypothetical protein